jgi:hypothetical protein
MMGISHYYGLEVAFDKSPHNAKAVIEDIGSHLIHGLTGRRKAT